MKCTDISSRLVDFLYEEIAPAERAAFNAHLTGCPTCAAEVKASSRALQRTRTALAGPLNEEPPARVHANILAAARAAAQPARKPRVEQKEGFFTRLWKAPWLIPAMGAAGVATAVFLIKVIKNPEVLPVREPASPPAVVGKPQPTEEQAPSPVLLPAGPQPESKSLGAKDEERAVARAKRERAGAAPARSAPAAAQGAIHRKLRIGDDPLDGIGAGGYGVAPSPPKMPEPQVERAAPAAKRAAPATKSVTGAWAEPPPPREPSGFKKRGNAFDDLDVGEGASGAGPSQPRGQLQQARPQESVEAYRPAAAAPPPTPAAAPMPSAAPSRPAAARDQSFAKAKRSAAAENMAEEAESMADSAPPSNAPAAESARADKKGGAKKDSFEERVRKADKLYSQEKWYEALVAYRALLDEAPNHPSAPTWRQRFLLADKAHKESSPVRAKSKISDDALDEN